VNDKPKCHSRSLFAGGQLATETKKQRIEIGNSRTLAKSVASYAIHAKGYLTSLKQLCYKRVKHKRSIQHHGIKEETEAHYNCATAQK
jgi:hypothetical protein